MSQSQDFPTAMAFDLSDEECFDLTDEDFEALANGEPLPKREILGQGSTQTEYDDMPIVTCLSARNQNPCM